MTGGTTADVRSDGVAKDAEEATFTTKTISPVRAQARYLFGVETTVRVDGVENALRADARSVLADKLDSLAINGQAAVTDTSPAVEGILSAITAPTDPTSSAGADEFLDAFLDRIDGKYSVDASNVRLLINADAYKRARKQKTSTGDFLFGRLPATDRIRASANLPATSSTISQGLTYTGGRVGMYQPVWRGIQVVRDPYTRAANGQVALTVIMLVGQALVDANPYARVAFKLS